MSSATATATAVAAVAVAPVSVTVTVAIAVSMTRTLAHAAVAVAVTVTIPIPLAIFVALLESSDVLVKCRSSEIFCVQRSVLFKHLDPRSNLFPRILHANHGIEVLDTRSEGVNAASLMSLRLILVIFAPTQYLLSQLETSAVPWIFARGTHSVIDQMQRVLIEVSDSRIIADDRHELVDRSLLLDLESFLLGGVSRCRKPWWA